MSQERELLPRSVYLSPATIEEAEKRARDLGIPLGTLLRLIVIGKQNPIRE